MLTIEEILPKEVFQQKDAYIFDHGKKDKEGVLKYQDSRSMYSWRQSQRGADKVAVRTAVLFRHPTKATSDGKFEIFGGGVIESIKGPDADGKIVATISHSFEFLRPIRQGDDDLENMVWTSKTKDPYSWKNFWGRYGMNRISVEDFKTLVKGRSCMLFKDGRVELPKIEDDRDIVTLHGEDNFTVTLDRDEKASSTSSKSSKKRPRSYKVDFNAIQKERDKVGALGELIVLAYWENKMLKDKLKGSKSSEHRMPVHVSKTEGDGLGYDIRAWAGGKELHIEVKTTKTKYIDKFYMSSNELKVARADGDSYRIYRVYNLDMKNKTCNLFIYDKALLEEQFCLTPTMYRVNKK